MSEENVELVRRATDAFAAEDVEGLVGCADPAIEFEPHLAAVERGGRDQPLDRLDLGVEELDLAQG